MVKMLLEEGIVIPMTGTLEPRVLVPFKAECVEIPEVDVALRNLWTLVRIRSDLAGVRGAPAKEIPTPNN